MSEFKARPTIYKGIHMRSRLEAGFAGWLDRSNIEWEYEPFAVGDEHGQYLPDFVLRHALFFPLDDTRETMANPDTPGVAVEVKPTAASVDLPRLVRAAEQLGQSGLCVAMVVLVVADEGTFSVFPHHGWASSLSELPRMTWVLDTQEDGETLRTLLTWATEPPFAKDWWT